MRVLWFTNIPLVPVTRRLGFPNEVIGGWMDSLRGALQSYPELELGAASALSHEYEPFEEGGTTFYNIPRPSQSGSVEAVYRRWTLATDFPNGMENCSEIIKKFKPDIIHVHGSESFYGLITRQTSIPVVLSMQGILTVIEKYFFGGLTFQDLLVENISKNFIKGTSTLHGYLTIKKAARREREIIKACRYFTGRTEFDKNFVSLINPQGSYYHCDDILRPPFYNAAWNSQSSGPLKIYCTMTPAPYKGLDCLLNAVSILKMNGFPDIQIRIGGHIQQTSIWRVIQNKVKALDLSDQVVWLGEISAENITTELKNAHVFVLPSFIDNSPNSLGEAMLVGTPSIASYVGGVPSMISHGKDGLLFPAGDAYSLAAMIARVTRDPSLAQTLSASARATAQKRHDPQKIAEAMINIYSEIMGNNIHHGKNI